MSKRRTHSPEFKARVAMEAISGRKTIQEIAADHAIHPIQVSQWKRQLLDVDWYNHQHRRCGKAIEICRRRARVYELARIANPKRWSRSIRCWKQPDLVGINEPLATQQTSLQVTLACEA